VNLVGFVIRIILNLSLLTRSQRKITKLLLLAVLLYTV